MFAVWLAKLPCASSLPYIVSRRLARAISESYRDSLANYASALEITASALLKNRTVHSTFTQSVTEAKLTANCRRDIQTTNKAALSRSHNRGETRGNRQSSYEAFEWRQRFSAAWSVNEMSALAPRGRPQVLRHPGKRARISDYVVCHLFRKEGKKMGYLASRCEADSE